MGMARLFMAAALAVLLSSELMAAPLQDREVTVFGQRIHYAEAGQGRPLILLHGLWGGQNEWLPVLPALSKNHHVIVMDMLGFHGSAKPGVQYHNALMSQFLAGFIAALQLEDVVLVGHAMGANTASYTAVHHPQNVAALVLIDGAGYRSADRDLAAVPSEAMLRFRRVATGASLAATRGLLERRVLNKSLVTSVWVEQAFAMWIASAAAIGDMLTEGGDVSDEEMRQIALPVLIVWGAEDKVFSPDNATRLNADIENATLRIIEASGHLPQLEQTDAFLAAVLPFLHQLD